MINAKMFIDAFPKYIWSLCKIEADAPQGKARRYFQGGNMQ
jgi:hypothetical protein